MFSNKKKDKINMIKMFKTYSKYASNKNLFMH